MTDETHDVIGVTMPDPNPQPTTAVPVLPNAPYDVRSMDDLGKQMEASQKGDAQ